MTDNVIALAEEQQKRGRGRPKHSLNKKKAMSPAELQMFWSGVVRGDVKDQGKTASMSERLRASELLAKSHNLFNQNITFNNAPHSPIDSLSDEEVDKKMKELLEQLDE